MRWVHLEHFSALFAFRIQSSLIIRGFILLAFMQMSSLKCTSDLNICSKRKKQTKFSGQKYDGEIRVKLKKIITCDTMDHPNFNVSN